MSKDKKKSDKKAKKVFKDPNKYVLPNDSVVKLGAEEYKFIEQIVSVILEKRETQVTYPEFYNYLDNKSGKFVEKATMGQLQSGEVKEIVDFQATMQNQRPIVSRTEYGQQLLQVKLILARIFQDAVEDGTAILKAELPKETPLDELPPKEFPKGKKMEVVK